MTIRSDNTTNTTLQLAASHASIELLKERCLTNSASDA